MRTTTSTTLLAATGLLLTAAATAPAATAGAPVADQQVHGRTGHTLAKQGEATAYWTPERMRRATDRTQHLPIRKPAPGAARTQAERPGTPATVAGIAPTLASSPESPRKTIGKVFFTMGGKDFVCSANSVTAANKSVVSTAGHCVNEGPGSYAERFVFVPSYDNGDAPYGEWTGVSAYTPDEWSQRGDINQDTAFVVVDKLDGATLADTVGATGVAFNQARGRQYTSFGYPAAPPFDGETLRSCQGTASDDTVGGPGRQSQGIPCDMTGGSSGGPWFLGSGYNGPSSVQNSVNSYGYGKNSTTMYGPYWGSTIQKAYKGAVNDPGTRS